VTAPTLTDFLLARIAEDEAVAREKTMQTPMDCALEWDSDRDYGERYLMVDPARVLAECEARRRIVERAEHLHNPEGDTGVAAAFGEAVYICAILAAVYADHPDYDEAWRP
jgi:hypothetical protein